MQDGQFQHGQRTHPIGPAVFVFAGSTCSTMEAFIERVTPRESAAVSGRPAGLAGADDRENEEDEQDRRAVRDAKGTDFVSRLKGFVNVIGPNPRNDDPVDDPHS